MNGTEQLYSRLRAILESPDFTGGEKRYIEFQWSTLLRPGSFYSALFEAISRADPENLARLRLAFPEEVDAVVAWREGDFAERVAAMGVSA